MIVRLLLKKLVVFKYWCFFFQQKEIERKVLWILLLFLNWGHVLCYELAWNCLHGTFSVSWIWLVWEDLMHKSKLIGTYNSIKIGVSYLLHPHHMVNFKYWKRTRPSFPSFLHLLSIRPTRIPKLIFPGGNNKASLLRLIESSLENENEIAKLTGIYGLVGWMKNGIWALILTSF